MINARFTLWLLAMGAVGAVGGWLALGSIAEGRVAYLAGLAFSALTIGVGYHLARWAVPQGETAFIMVVFGGMLGRLALTLAFAILIWMTTAWPLVVTMVALIGYYLLFSALEIVFLIRRVRT